MLYIGCTSAQLLVQPTVLEVQIAWGVSASVVDRVLFSVQCVCIEMLLVRRR